MTVCVFTHPACLLHDPGRTHPESPWRLRALLDALAENPMPWVQVKQVVEKATAEHLKWVHDPAYIDRVLSFRGKHGKIDPETILCPGSVDAMLWAAGGAMSAVDEVVGAIGGTAKTAWVLGRPPGHHAESGRGMGFCVVNHIAVAAMHARRRGVGRIAILDIDVHHGNGTQEIFWDDPDVLFVSSHQQQLFPATTGSAAERGGKNAMGTNLNLPLKPGTHNDGFMRVWTDVAQPVIESFKPELLLVSAGFDAHVDDPLGGVALTESGYARFCRWLEDLAVRWTGGRSVWIWEGGYDGPALQKCLMACLRTWEPTADVDRFSTPRTAL